MTPTKIILEATDTCLRLRGFASETQEGSFVIESIPFSTGASLPTLRKQGAAYAKRFAIEFFDQTNQ